MDFEISDRKRPHCVRVYLGAPSPSRLEREGEDSEGQSPVWRSSVVRLKLFGPRVLSRERIERVATAPDLGIDRDLLDPLKLIEETPESHGSVGKKRKRYLFDGCPLHPVPVPNTQLALFLSYSSSRSTDSHSPKSVPHQKIDEEISSPILNGFEVPTAVTLDVESTIPDSDMNNKTGETKESVHLKTLWEGRDALPSLVDKIKEDIGGDDTFMSSYRVDETGIVPLAQITGEIDEVLSGNMNDADDADLLLMEESIRQWESARVGETNRSVMDFVPLRDLKLGSVFSICVLVRSIVGPRTVISRQKGTSYALCEIICGDQTESFFSLSVWGNEQCEWVVGNLVPSDCVFVAHVRVKKAWRKRFDSSLNVLSGDSSRYSQYSVVHRAKSPSSIVKESPHSLPFFPSNMAFHPRVDIRPLVSWAATQAIGSSLPFRPKQGMSNCLLVDVQEGAIVTFFGRLVSLTASEWYRDGKSKELRKWTCKIVDGSDERAIDRTWPVVLWGWSESDVSALSVGLVYEFRSFLVHEVDKVSESTGDSVVLHSTTLAGAFYVPIDHPQRQRIERVCGLFVSKGFSRVIFSTFSELCSSGISGPCQVIAQPSFPYGFSFTPQLGCFKCGAVTLSRSDDADGGVEHKRDANKSSVIPSRCPFCFVSLTDLPPGVSPMEWRFPDTEVVLRDETGAHGVICNSRIISILFGVPPCYNIRNPWWKWHAQRRMREGWSDLLFSLDCLVLRDENGVIRSRSFIATDVNIFQWKL